MTRIEPGRMRWPRVAWRVARSSVVSLYEHWPAAFFSLGAALAIWFVIQDVENPKVQATFPADGSNAIPVEAKNADLYIPTSTYSVSVTVEGRKDDVANLSQEDFEASIDIKGLVPGQPESRTVKVVSKKSGVRVLFVDKPTVSVSVAPVVEQQFDVVVNRIGQLPAGFSEDDIKIEPPQVTVRGLQDDLASIASVSVGVNLSNLREGATVIENELIARSITGARVDVSVTPNRAKVTLEVKQDFVQRTLPVVPILSGQPAAGYRITSISVEPAAISVSGPASQMASQTQLPTEAIQLTNATGEIRLLRNIDAPQNFSLERRTVTVIITVKPIDCPAGPAGTPCGSVTMQVAPVPENQPPTLFIVGSARVSVQLTGPLPVLDSITPGQVQAKVSLAGAVAGTGLYPVTVTLPVSLTSQGVRAEQPSPIQLTLATP
ncbi:MAG: CdaR family protein [bacterium]